MPADEYCGPKAVAAVTGWTAQQAILHIRALRERAGSRRMTVRGTSPSEYHDAIRRAGYALEEDRGLRGWSVRDMLRDQRDRSGWWIVSISGHVFATQRGRVRSGGRVNPRARVMAVHRVYRVTP